MALSGRGEKMNTIEVKLYLKPAQEKTLTSWLRTCCGVCNRALDMRIKAYKRRKESVNHNQQQALLTRQLVVQIANRFFVVIAFRNLLRSNPFVGATSFFLELDCKNCLLSFYSQIWQKLLKKSDCLIAHYSPSPAWPMSENSPDFTVARDVATECSVEPVEGGFICASDADLKPVTWAASPVGNRWLRHANHNTALAVKKASKVRHLIFCDSHASNHTRFGGRVNAGRVAIQVDPSGTSQTCPKCGAVKKKRLSERTHSCGQCGLVRQRDHASAQVILARGLRALGPNRLLTDSASGSQLVVAGQADRLTQEHERLAAR